MLKIKPEEIESVQEIGMLDGEPVSLLKTVGGFHMAASKGKGVLAQGSHPAIVRYNVAKQHKGFSPILAKSEENEPLVFGMSDLLPEGMYEKGFDLYSLEKNESTGVEFVLTKSGADVVVLSGQSSSDEIVITDITGNDAKMISKYIPVVASVISDDAHFQGKKVRVAVK